jgi:hypothetical protein
MRRAGFSARGLLAALLVVVATTEIGSAAAQTTPPTPPQSAPPETTVAAPTKPKPLLTLGEVVGLNTLIWSYDRYLRQNGENPGFKIGFNSWEENFKNGFEWDDNSFSTNQYAHPYHGNMYFNAARSNGYDFWTSVPFVFTGSFLWEYMYETHHPSYNDWIATSVGGTTLGEMLYRLSDLVLDNRATGSGRRWREFGGLVLDPVRGFNRIISGEATRVGPNPAGHRPEYLAVRFDGGLRTLGVDHVYDTDTTRTYLAIQGQYGDMFRGNPKKPFDAFDFGVNINFGEANVLGSVQTRGLLYADHLHKSPTTEHMLGLFLNFDYHNTNAYTIGGQSAGAGIISRFHKTFLGEIETQAHLNTVFLGGVSSDYATYTGRSYDYGPGLNTVLSAALRRHNRPWLVVRHSQTWIHTLNGTEGEHHISVTNARFDIPINTLVGFGAQYVLYLAENDYKDLPDTSKRSPELRFFFSLPLE